MIFNVKYACLSHIYNYLHVEDNASCPCGYPEEDTFSSALYREYTVTKLFDVLDHVDSTVTTIQYILGGDVTISVVENIKRLYAIYEYTYHRWRQIHT